MKKIDLGQTISILANIGVIAGIVFLAVELNQNNALLTAQARADRTALAKEAVTRFLENPDLIRVAQQRQRGESLSDEDQLKIEYMLRAQLVNQQHIYTEYSEGLISVEDVPVALWRDLHQNQWPDLPEYWERTKQNYRPAFVRFYDENVASD